MTVNKKKMNVTALQLSNYEMVTLNDARETLNLLFSKLTAKDNITQVANILQALEDLIETLEENGNGILEFEEDK